ncbi:nucleoside deaminase [Dactylosporangium sp. NPDC005572]|uniref:nucleoside deaminase n=1 Tax=Dactylosporangium sp. NPDC005572 TaxID=3156889 RepID=UPI0033ACAF9B
MELTTTRFGVGLPGWVAEEIARVEPALPDVEARMRVAHRLARRNHREGTGGPFAAVVSDAATGEVLSVGVNLVLASGLSGMHAEVVALCLAQAGAGTWDLGGAGRPPVELAVNWRPCAMCYGAVLWSGVARLVIAGEGDEVEHLTGFDEGPMRPDWKEQLAARGVDVRTDVLRDEALDTFREYGERSDVVVYNGGGRGRGPETQGS